MTTWVLKTLEKKSVEETEFWTKDGQTIKRITGFRWGTVYCESDERPDIDLTNPDGLEVFATDYDFELDSLDDGWYGDVEYPEDMSDEERERMDELWDLQTPVLLMHGEHDYILPELATMARDRLPRGQLAYFRGCSHMPFFEAPDRYRAELQRFLSAP